MAENDSKTSILQETINKEILEKSKVHLNLEEGFIITTEDKIKLCLIRYLKGLEKKNSWITPLGLLITVIVTFLTTDFKDWLFSKYTWQAIFLISGAIFFVWLIFAFFVLCKTKTIEDIVEEIKKSSKQINGNKEEIKKNLPSSSAEPSQSRAKSVRIFSNTHRHVIIPIKSGRR